ncbi:MAG: RCC1 repeat-containing protein [Acidimicrobiia bacterium]|nr:RCC1 repeat-containing protein [Acidimicrobiia bacterium]
MASPLSLPPSTAARLRLLGLVILGTAAVLVLAGCQKGLLTDAVDVQSGGSHTCAIQTDGTVWCWGANTFGQIGDGSTTTRKSPARVGKGFTAVAAGTNHSCAIASDGRPRCWGLNGSGQLGDGSTSNRTEPATVLDLTEGQLIAAGGAHSCAVRTDGTAACWGANASGQLGDGTTALRTTAVGVSGLAGVTDLEAGASHTCAALLDGSARCWGNGGNGRLGHGSTSGSPVPAAVNLPPGANATKVTAAETHSCALLADGTVWCWGANSSGQLGDGTTTVRTSPVQVVGLGGPASDVSAGRFHTCAVLVDSDTRCWGSNVDGGLGNGTTTLSPVPVTVASRSPITAVSANGPGSGGRQHTCGRYEDGRVGCWGGNTTGQLGHVVDQGALTPSVVGAVIDLEAATEWDATGTAPQPAISSGTAHSCVVIAGEWDEGGFCWGSNNRSQLGLPSAEHTQPLGFLTPGLASAARVVAGYQHTCMAAYNRTVWCMGENTVGQLGNGSTASVGALTQVPGFVLDERLILTAGRDHTCGVAAGGLAHCWGGNSSGQLGDGTTTMRTTPVPVSTATGLGGVAELVAGGQHTCAIDAGRSSMYCWGANGSGQLGDASYVDRTTPTPIAFPFTDQADFLTMALGDRHTCALGDFFVSREVSCWGHNSHGQLGDGTTTSTFGGMPVVGLTSATHLAAGRDFSCAVDSSTGQGWCWGRNNVGQLGDGTTEDRHTPTQIATDRYLVGIAAGSDARTGCAMADNGLGWGGLNVLCWGVNTGGALGRNSGSSTPSPDPGLVVMPPFIQ